MTGTGRAWEALPIFFEPTTLVEGLDRIVATHTGFVAWGPTATGSAIVASGQDQCCWFGGIPGSPGGFDHLTIQAVSDGPRGALAAGVDASDVSHIWSSSNGLDWAEVSGVTGIDGKVGDMTSQGGGYVAAGRAKDGCGLRAWRSSDGKTWHVSAPWPGSVAACTDTPLVFSIRVGAAGLVAFGTVRGVGGVGDAFWTSADGVTWA
ncbi:MAG: hypothetical protein ACRDF7_10115, partial [Candidatus Limnocylindrales bacterium]